MTTKLLSTVGRRVFSCLPASSVTNIICPNTAKRSSSDPIHTFHTDDETMTFTNKRYLLATLTHIALFEIENGNLKSKAGKISVFAIMSSEKEREAIASGVADDHYVSAYDPSSIKPYDPPPVYGDSFVLLPKDAAPAYDSQAAPPPPVYEQVVHDGQVTVSDMGVFSCDPKVFCDSTKLNLFFHTYRTPPGFIIKIKGDPINPNDIGNLAKEKQARMRGHFKSDFWYVIDASAFINPTPGMCVPYTKEVKDKSFEDILSDFVISKDKNLRITLRKGIVNVDLDLLTKCIQGHFRGKLNYQGVITVEYELNNYKIVVSRNKKAVEKIYTDAELRDMGKGKGLFDSLFNMTKKEITKEDSLKAFCGFHANFPTEQLFHQLVPYLHTGHA